MSEFVQSTIFEARNRPDKHEFLERHLAALQADANRVDDYHALTKHYLSLFVPQFMTHVSNRYGSGTLKNYKSFFTNHFDNLYLTNIDQVRDYYEGCNFAASTIKVHFDKVCVFLRFVMDMRKTELFEQIIDHYAEWSGNLSGLHKCWKQQEPLPVTVESLLKVTASLQAKRNNIITVLALKTAINFALRGDPGLIRLRDYDENVHPYYKDGVIYQPIVVKDKLKKYGHVRKVYNLLPEEKKWLDEHIAKHPRQRFLFNKNNEASETLLSENFNSRIIRELSNYFGTNVGTSIIRKVFETQFGNAIRLDHVLQQEKKWSAFAEQNGHKLTTVLSYYYRPNAQAPEADPESEEQTPPDDSQVEYEEQEMEINQEQTAGANSEVESQVVPIEESPEALVQPQPPIQEKIVNADLDFVKAMMRALGTCISAGDLEGSKVVFQQVKAALDRIS